MIRLIVLSFAFLTINGFIPTVILATASPFKARAREKKSSISSSTSGQRHAMASIPVDFEAWKVSIEFVLRLHNT